MSEKDTWRRQRAGGGQEAGCRLHSRHAKSIDGVGNANLNALENHMKAVARKLNSTPVVLQLTEIERQASKVVPRRTPAAGAERAAGESEALAKVPAEVRSKFPVKGGLNTAELQCLINGNHSALDIKYMLDAQSQRKADLQDILKHLEILKAAGLITM